MSVADLLALIDLVAAVLIAGGLAFFVAGSVGMLRFPDAHSRLHAVTKADNLGLGLIVLGAMLRAGSARVVLKLALVWVLAIVASAVAAQTIARATLPPREGPEP